MDNGEEEEVLAQFGVHGLEGASDSALMGPRTQG